ncbi:homocysteine S-methyltransferase family protein [Candidatus Weimeria sp. HCP3S3_B5]|uniref:homocysteine S-methyltransferase family protein n=1 Tax=Candidatus Weimeria sp. HCP3S3_B5 TaxID=3438871 RepID=UPI003F8B35AA
MTIAEFKNLFEEGRPVYLDGAVGTNMMKAGMPMGVCPEKWLVDNPLPIGELQKAYVDAGSDIVLAPTFAANRIKLQEYSLSDQVDLINRTLAENTRKATGGRCLVAGDMTMTGQQLAPIGELDFEELVDVYKQQAKALIEGGVDLFFIETMMSLQETRAALIAVKEIAAEIPAITSLTFNEDGKTLFGSSPSNAIVVLQSLGADAVGLNCSTGPDKMVPLIEEMRRYATVPIIAKPNAGLPELIDQNTVYRMTPDEFAADMEKLVEAGAAVIGGCCGTTPEHIRAMVDKTRQMRILPPDPVCRRVISSERKVQEIDPDGNFLVIGERINPTGKKKLQEELRAGSLDMVNDFARSQEENGADILDVNMGTNGIDEKEMMLRAIDEVTFASDLPLCIDTSYPEVMEAALRRYPGRALINSISGEEERMEAMLPIARKYGAMFIILPLSSEGLPKTLEEKHANLERVLAAVKEAGMSWDRCVVDVLTATVGADQESAIKCFSTMDYCRKKGIPTVCGLSNISFGMPERAFVNTAFLNMAISHGLAMAIANPSQKLLMLTAKAADMLLCRRNATENYIKTAQEADVAITGKESAGAGKEKDSQEKLDPVMEAVVKGDTSHIEALVKKEVSDGRSAKDILDKDLIPGINMVGKLYEEKKYFLPQMISGANAMEKGVAVLEPLMKEAAGGQTKETICCATVEGDIHDIGKNLVVLMLKNYGYNVIDLGKDVPAEEIIDSAIENKASVIGLSALMTTTMVHMKEVVELKNEKYPSCKVVIGGACITPSYSDEIGADGYSSDAAECVKLVGRLLS